MKPLAPEQRLSVFAVDPGGTTGWALLAIDAGKLKPGCDVAAEIDHWEQGQVEGLYAEQGLQLGRIADDNPYAAVVIEDFQVREMAVQLSPVEVTAALTYHLYMGEDEYRVPFKQMPSLAKSTATDLRLKAWGYYVPGSEHARDATRHGITFLRRAAKDPILRAEAWPWHSPANR